MPSKASNIKKRKYIRYPADTNTLAHISLQDDVNDFQPEFLALVLTESFKGCGVVMRANDEIRARRNCAIKCGALDPVIARIAWVQALDAEVIKVGFEFLS